LGERRCIVIGGITVAVGHFLLGGPAYFPFLIERLTGVPAADILHQSGVKLGLLLPGESIWLGLHAHLTTLASSASFPDPGAAIRWIEAAYLLVGWSFMAGLTCIVVGTGFIKATISSIVGKFYRADDPRREAGFTIFMVGVWIGSMSANFIAGTLGEKVGWHYGFMAAGVGMTVGLLLYLWKQRKLLGEIGRLPDRRVAPATRARLGQEERDRLWVVGVMGLFTILYSTAFYQKGGLIHLMVKEATDRTIAGFEIPATWFLTISTGGFIALAPVASWLWQRLERRGSAPDAIQKQAMGLLALTVGYLFLLGARAELANDGAASMAWIVTAYLFFAVGDVFIWPPQIAAASKLAPARITSLVIGSWYVTVGVGTFIAGWVGALAYEFSTTAVFAGLLLACLVGAVALLGIRHRLTRMMHGVVAK
jgi:POT family proton-dependent oligopeptide transporter